MVNRALDKMRKEPPERFAKFMPLWQNICRLFEDIEIESYSRIDYENCLRFKEMASGLIQRLQEFEHKTL